MLGVLMRVIAMFAGAYLLVGIAVGVATTALEVGIREVGWRWWCGMAVAIGIAWPWFALLAWLEWRDSEREKEKI